MTGHTALTALAIGTAFGVVLERAGLGDPRVIAAQFTGRDFTVVRVMFSAIVTAMLGLGILEEAGLLSLAALSMPPTDIAGQVIGGVVFGAGFGAASLCPGTACVAAASGRREGFAAVVGLMLGTLLTVIAWPVFALIATFVPREHATLAADLNVDRSLVVLAVVSVGVLAMIAIRSFESRTEGTTIRVRTSEVAALVVAGMLAIPRSGSGSSDMTALAQEIEQERDHVDPLELAQWIRDGRDNLRIIDLRDDVDSMDYRIPSAEIMSLAQLQRFVPKRAETVVLYSEGGAHAAQAWVLLRARGISDVFVLKDGLAAWEDEVLQPIVPTDSGNANVMKRFAHTRELSIYFGGHPRIAPAGGSQGTTQDANAKAVKPRRRNTC